MKKYILIINIFAFLMFGFTACNEDVLDKTPVSSYDGATVWTSINLADAFLKTGYANLYLGIISDRPDLTSIADEVDFLFIWNTDVYLLGRLTADNLGNFTGSDFRTFSWNLFANIQVINTFLENIDKVPKAYPASQQAAIQAKADIMKGEALFLRAWCYSQMVKTYGGLPLMKKSWNVGDDYLTTVRSTFKETIDFIVADCDAAAAALKSKAVMESGRATNAAALALKSRTLLFAASDLTADGTAASALVGYTSPNRTALWTAARDAAKAVMNLNVYTLKNFGAPDKGAVAANYYDFFKQYTLADPEIIWGRMFVADVGDRSRTNYWLGPNGWDGYSEKNPTQAFVDDFEMEDGSKFFDHYYVDANGYYKNKGTTKYRNASPYYNREPRFYGSVLFDSASFQPRQPVWVSRDPLGQYDRRTRIVMQGGKEISKTYGIDTRNSGYQSWNGSYTGYCMKKFTDNNVVGQSDYNVNIWIEFRYAEILFNYAEACLALGDNATATTYINLIRNRAGLPDFTGDITTALRHERKMELAFERLRWFDIRRWKILEPAFANLTGMDIVEIKNLDNGTTTTTWQTIPVRTRNYDKKLYWIPISTTELKKAPQLVQNPGY